jgi:CrcB protein
VLPRPSLLLAVFAGGCAGGLARYLLTRALPGGPFPWATLGINLSGAFLLALLLVLVLEVLAPSTYVRPLLGTGFCGAWTTFSGIVVPADELLRDGRAATAVAYLAASSVGGLAAGFVGLALGRRVARRRTA